MVTCIAAPLFFSLLASCFVSTSYAAPADSGVAGITNFSLYAYDNSYGLGGLSVFYREGLTYIGNLKNMSATSFTNITFSPSSDDKTAYVATPASSDGTINGTQKLTINGSAGSFDQVKITSSSNGQTTGFTVFGDQLFLVNNSLLTTKWYATPQSNEAGVYALKWNSDLVEDGKSAPVILKTVAPANFVDGQLD